VSVELHQATSNYRNVTGLFCRASWNDDYTTKARALVEAPDWQPPMRLRASLLMEPLILHNAALAGIAPEQVFRPNSYVAEPLAFDEAALTYHGRRHLMTKTFTSLAESGITEVLLVKGAVLAERYDAPALRPMSDIDLILRPDDLTKVASALARGSTHKVTSWIRCRQPPTKRRQCGNARNQLMHRRRGSRYSHPMMPIIYSTWRAMQFVMRDHACGRIWPISICCWITVALAT
jgi:hypothetical protein